MGFFALGFCYHPKDDGKAHKIYQISFQVKFSYLKGSSKLYINEDFNFQKLFQIVL